ncbi:hypothetical protein CC85DRAFT_269460 [Cutaneotrichosporon oleaginosum]|uniref:Right handed beta helix domain-containing protein n=1 Tax=Cutaneotrichosporon oleaginosum TaxID=879819 RepID=A0A0J0XWV4_9TREE|nr:uncharacterized protein CC85DRAFT_269460 [Cutaneotrichosporon oleaginosum]KLT45545.1 hypothetical protein CC85DRAFT_269460 [Cutaneotrichosporon oleaginosum]TXT14501.1 hypothetical protein COLE_00694 [Cutaneotrichosporon oleaginosum]
MRLHLAPLLLLPLAAGKSECLPSGDERPINEALSRGGAGATVTLCPGSVHHLYAPIHFTAPRQTLTTSGQVVGHDRAMIIVQGEEQSVAICGDCPGCDYLTVSDVIIDGNRPQLLRIPKGEALIEMGNADGHRVTGCRLYEPRGWSALHIREGDRKQCRRAHIDNNVIGPCGEEWDEEYDGFVEKEPVWGNPRADGISLACKESVVEHNVVFDTTDGAIVIFGSAGSEVHSNHVYSRTRVVLGGINLVDYEPWDGDYSGTRVHDNKIMAPSGFLKVGIVIGPSSWSDDTDTSVFGGTVVDNTFSGQRFGYAMVVSSARDFTVLRNAVLPGSEFIGVPGVTCPTAPENGPPQAFLINRGSAHGTFQPEFANGEVQHIICINPPPYRERTYKPWRLRDAPEAIAARAAAEVEANPNSKLSERVADSLVAYQYALLDALERISNVTAEEPAEGTDASPTDERLSALERGDKELRKELAKLNRAVAKLTGNVGEAAEARSPVLKSVYEAVRRRPDPVPVRATPATHAASVSVGVVLSAGAVLALALALLRRWRRSAAKGLKSR